MDPRKFILKTYTGKVIRPHDIRPEDVEIDEVAHALANLNRFNGHSRLPMPVAHHSVLVSLLCDPEDAKEALLHDAAEAYVGDLIEPIKKWLRYLGQRGFDELEWHTTQSVWTRFDIPFDPNDSSLSPSVRWADMSILVMEMANLYGDEDPVKEWGLPEEIGGRALPRPVGGRPVVAVNPHTGWSLGEFTPLPWKGARDLFLDRFNELFS